MDNTQTQLDDEIEIDLWELFQVLLKNWLWILLSTLGCAILGLLITMFFLPRIRKKCAVLRNSVYKLSVSRMTVGGLSASFCRSVEK